MTVPEAARAKALLQLTALLKDLEEFRLQPEKAGLYAETVVTRMSSEYSDKESFRDQLMGLLANIRNLDGELEKVGPSLLATMKPEEMLSSKQRRDRDRFLRKRVREQILYDVTSMLCATCKLVRPDRLNLNQLALDSEENGTHFDYNFDNLCQCDHRSDEDERSTSTLSSLASENNGSAADECSPHA
ncbi:hypothetical protein TCDM_14190 [Trypanosoma cruzi Dm28c]|uniref:TFIIS central domain-containing protein n=2 Tax=Trypanosoma cruzi TaxID=5693 RepID=V5DRU1_TRYCR|nr:hypothetical protein TCDM_14190 [Trypanosoma cruzi Dm28c]KAF8288870.1 putative Transcription factor S-II (TFIIS), central domain containing protein [Trypanosoma cruzi]PBJ71899.1 hypothetical protein BCY84_16119 [Trypanosoma cruzi cruzi]PWU98164.1 hypothetical protein C4B63_13g143 [Trypanosoma cruzi]